MIPCFSFHSGSPTAYITETGLVGTFMKTSFQSLPYPCRPKLGEFVRKQGLRDGRTHGLQPSPASRKGGHCILSPKGPLAKCFEKCSPFLPSLEPRVHWLPRESPAGKKLLACNPEAPKWTSEHFLLVSSLLTSNRIHCRECYFKVCGTSKCFFFFQ